MQASRASQAFVPRLFAIDDICAKSGADFGAFRPLFTQDEGGYKMTFEEEQLCKLVIPFQVGRGR